MARKSAKTESKIDVVVGLAKRPSGVNAAEIVEATAWPSGSPKWRLEHAGASRGLKCVPHKRADGTYAFRLVAAGKASKSAKAPAATAPKTVTAKKAAAKKATKKSSKASKAATTPAAGEAAAA